MGVIWAIDPGEVHNGLAIFNDGECVKACERSPEVLFAELQFSLERGDIDAVVVEEYRIYPWMLQQHGFSSVKTVEVIGVIRYLCEQAGVPMHEQGASIKKMCEARLRAKQYRYLAHGHGRHAKDAELHGQWYLMKLNREVA